MDASFTRVQYNEDKTFTLISLMKAMKEGYEKSGNDKVGIVLAKGDHKIIFDIPIITKEDVLWCINMQHKESLAKNETALASTTKIPTYNTTKAHS